MDFTGAIIGSYNSLPRYWWLWLILTAVGTLIVLRAIGKRKKTVCIALLAAYVLFILFETVIGRSSGEFRAELIPFWSFGIPELRTEIIMKNLLFIPFGFLLSICVNRWMLCVEIGFVMSACIELHQLITRTGSFEFDDIIRNTIGCLIGVGIGKTVLKLRRETQ